MHACLYILAACFQSASCKTETRHVYSAIKILHHKTYIYIKTFVKNAFMYNLYKVNALKYVYMCSHGNYNGIYYWYYPI